MGRKLIGVPRAQARPATEPRPAAEPEGAEPADAEREVPGTRPMVPESAEEDATTVAMEQSPSWVDNVKDAIPVEVVTAWVAIDAIILGGSSSPDGFYWAVFGLVFVGTGLHMWIDIELPDPEEAAGMNLTPGKLRIAVMGQIAMAMGAFLAWGLYLAPVVDVPIGGATVALDKPRTTAILVLYTLLGPQLVPGLLSKVVGVDLDPGDGSIDVDRDDETPT